MPPEGPEHAQLSTDAADYLRYASSVKLRLSLLEEKALVRDAKPITIPETSSEPEPDLAIVQPLRALYRTRHPYPENIFWVIEYANTSLSKDLDAKRKIYNFYRNPISDYDAFRKVYIFVVSIIFAFPISHVGFHYIPPNLHSTLFLNYSMSGKY
jgi:Uma2 family endonuclease